MRDPNTTEQVSALQSVRSAAYPRRDDEPNSQAKLDAYSPVHKNELPVHIPFMIVPSALKKINAFRAFEEKNFNFVPMAGFMVNFLPCFLFNLQYFMPFYPLFCIPGKDFTLLIYRE